jgi:hypothetical protein
MLLIDASSFHKKLVIENKIFVILNNGKDAEPLKMRVPSLGSAWPAELKALPELPWQKTIFGGNLFYTGVSGARAEDFQPARPGRVFQFPRDHGAHPDFKTEWWYYTGHLKSAAGETFGYQLTFFRVGLRKPDPKARSAWRADTVYFAHLAVSDPNRGAFAFREKIQRGAMGLAGAKEGRLKVWIDDWLLESGAKSIT